MYINDNKTGQTSALPHTCGQDDTCNRVILRIIIGIQNLASKEILKRNARSTDIIWQSQNGCLAVPHEVSNRH